MGSWKHGKCACPLNRWAPRTSRGTLVTPPLIFHWEVAPFWSPGDPTLAPMRRSPRLRCSTVHKDLSLSLFLSSTRRPSLSIQALGWLYFGTLHKIPFLQSIKSGLNPASLQNKQTATATYLKKITKKNGRKIIKLKKKPENLKTTCNCLQWQSVIKNISNQLINKPKTKLKWQKQELTINREIMKTNS